MLVVRGQVRAKQSGAQGLAEHAYRISPWEAAADLAAIEALIHSTKQKGANVANTPRLEQDGVEKIT